MSQRNGSSAPNPPVARRGDSRSVFEVLRVFAPISKPASFISGGSLYKLPVETLQVRER